MDLSGQAFWAIAQNCQSKSLTAVGIRQRSAIASFNFMPNFSLCSKNWSSSSVFLTSLAWLWGAPAGWGVMEASLQPSITHLPRPGFIALHWAGPLYCKPSHTMSWFDLHKLNRPDSSNKHSVLSKIHSYCLAWAVIAYAMLYRCLRPKGMHVHTTQRHSFRKTEYIVLGKTVGLFYYSLL